MNIQTISIFNLSESQTISVALFSSEDASLPSGGSLNISPKGSVTPAVQNGSMNLFIWNENSECIWQGIIPTKTQKIIEISPEKKKVFHNNMEIPHGFGPITSLDDSRFVKKSSNNFYIWIIAIAIILLFIVGYLGYFR